MEDLPFEIQSEILSYVLRESVLDCKLVSKTWKTLLSHRKSACGLLVSEHKFLFDSEDDNVKLLFGYHDEILGLTLIKDDDNCFGTKLPKIKLGKVRHPIANNGYYGSSLIGSCNGLVCLSIHNNQASDIYVFNPFTGECFKLPRIDKSQTELGFGYNPFGKNYKVVIITKEGLFQVYTLGHDSNGWRNIGEFNYSLVSRGILWNGSLHWLDRNQWRVVAFDLADEEFRFLPTTPSFEHSRDTQLTLLGGYLSIACMDRDAKRTSIWSFKKGHDPSWDWSLEFRIPFFPDHTHTDDRYEPFGLNKNNEVFLWCKKDRTFTTKSIVCRYDPKTDALIKVLDGGGTPFVGIPHMSSLVSLKALGVDSTTIDCPTNPSRILSPCQEYFCRRR